MKELAKLLVKDIENAHRTENFEEEFKEQSFENHIAEVENYLNGFENKHTFGDYCGLESKYFQPADFYNKEELKIICEEFDKMMFTYNLTIDYPENVPVSWMYNAIIETLDTQTSITVQVALQIVSGKNIVPV